MMRQKKPNLEHLQDFLLGHLPRMEPVCIKSLQQDRQTDLSQRCKDAFYTDFLRECAPLSIAGQ